MESKLKRAPDEVKLYFTERLEPAYSALRVLDARGVQVDRRDSRVDRGNPALLRATLPPLPPGPATTSMKNAPTSATQVARCIQSAPRSRSLIRCGT